jgi:hypothetical protein
VSGPETTAEAYDRGVAAGEILARLAGHDVHFATINGSMARVADEMHQLVLQVQRLGDAADADRSTVKTTAVALKDADDARRDQSATRWSPMARVIAVVGAVGAAVSTIAYLLATRH